MLVMNGTGEIMTIDTTSPSKRRTGFALLLSTALPVAMVPQVAQAQSDRSLLTSFEEASEKDRKSKAAFDKDDLGACDAALVASLWNPSRHDAVLRLGLMVADGESAEVRELLQQSRQAGNRCDPSTEKFAFEDTRFTAADAARLAVSWRVSDQRAREIITEKVNRREAASIDMDLETAAESS
jgi:hypothetical protein